MTDAEALEVAELARRIYRTLASRVPTDRDGREFIADRLARLQAKDALDELLALVDRSLVRS